MPRTAEQVTPEEREKMRQRMLGNKISVGRKRPVGSGNYDPARQEALRTEAKEYIPTKPCKRGHVCPRSTKWGDCSQCSLEKQRDPRFRAKRLLAGAVERARLYNLPFSLTEEYIKEIWPKDNLCPILRVPLIGPAGRKRGIQATSPTLDRIYPQFGYIRTNVAVISQRANAMKQDRTDPEEFRRLADWMEEKQQQFNPPEEQYFRP